jgi:uncharacterized coiled-coil DUF342 family protein
MAKTIAQKSIELAEQNAELTAQLSAAQAQANDLSARLVTAEKTAEMLHAQLAETETAAKRAAEAASAELATMTAERDALSQKAKSLAATLALNPQVHQSAGEKPVPGADAPVDGEGPQTWAEAMKLCGGNYVTARKKFPAIFDAFIEASKGKHNK